MIRTRSPWLALLLLPLVWQPALAQDKGRYYFGRAMVMDYLEAESASQYGLALTLGYDMGRFTALEGDFYQALRSSASGNATTWATGGFMVYRWRPLRRAYLKGKAGLLYEGSSHRRMTGIADDKRETTGIAAGLGMGYVSRRRFGVKMALEGELMRSESALAIASIGVRVEF